MSVDNRNPTDFVQLAKGGQHLIGHLERIGVPCVPKVAHAGGSENDLTAKLAEHLSWFGQPVQQTEQVAASAPHLGPVGGSGGHSAAAASSRTAPVEPAPNVASPGSLPPASREIPASTGSRSAAARGPVGPILDAVTNYSLPILDEDARISTLQQTAIEVSGCTRCPELAYTRKQTVFGEGTVRPRVCFFGEAPGADEDRSGRPFVGRAGQLLTKMIEACTFRREDVYIFNTIKCRPPGNRNPTDQEMANCRGYFEHQLNVLQPEYIVCLGAIASKALLMTTLPIGQLRGKFHRYRSSKVVVTYHPSYLLRNEEAKLPAWQDLQMLLRDMGIDPKAGKKPASNG